ncbi:HK97 gp10 family phage protein [Lacrimispora sp. 38-1]|uniref:HK97 gp10 family phage protein n=1 Tax=Lacrimispora sp. 38-1 TaxID=3125778 RepID=UPI003CF7913A
MSTFGQATRKRLEQLRKQGQNVPKIMVEVIEGATDAAVERATELTPPNGSSISGTGTRTGELAQAWATDSTTKATVIGGAVRTTLANNMQYASYVNDGHRMDKHFVPGLIVNGNMLEKVDPSLGGITVGTKTPYIKGVYMKQAAIGRYKNVVKQELDKRIRENFK